MNGSLDMLTAIRVLSTYALTRTDKEKVLGLWQIVIL
jgi:hypothetical protein